MTGYESKKAMAQDKLESMEREALKLALETFESMNHDDSIFKGEFDGEIAVIKKALAQEPKSVTYNEVADSMNSLRKGNSVQKAYAEEVGKLKLYTAPPQRKPLTQDGTMEIANQTAGQYWMDEAHIQRFRAAVEAAHGIKE